MDLFEHNSQSTHYRPLAERLRPGSLSALVGQKTFLNQYRGLIEEFKKGRLLSLVLWGPPGCGKTTFVRALTKELDSLFLVEENAIDLGAKKLKEIGEQAKYRQRVEQIPTLVFIDEIHRLNRAQQDVLLPFVEAGSVILMGATTENPSYELNAALVSRCRVIVFEPLSVEDVEVLYHRACKLESVTSEELLKTEARDALFASASGDGRRLLNTLEEIVLSYRSDASVFPLTVDEFHQRTHQSLRYDKNKDEHYDVISAFIKSIRGSDPDAGVYYLARMIEGGEDPIFIARRLVILASEDIGNADPNALPLAVAGLQAVQLIGFPEARIGLAQVVTYLASAPKSNRAYQAINKAQEEVRQSGSLPVPKALRSAQTKLSKQLGHGKGYLYSHDSQKGWREQDFLPAKLVGKNFYEPSERGFEKRILDYINWLKS